MIDTPEDSPDVLRGAAFMADTDDSSEFGDAAPAGNGGPADEPLADPVLEEAATAADSVPGGDDGVSRTPAVVNPDSFGGGSRAFPYITRVPSDDEDWSKYCVGSDALSLSLSYLPFPPIMIRVICIFFMNPLHHFDTRSSPFVPPAFSSH